MRKERGNHRTTSVEGTMNYCRGDQWPSKETAQRVAFFHWDSYFLKYLFGGDSRAPTSPPPHYGLSATWSLGNEKKFHPPPQPKNPVLRDLVPCRDEMKPCLIHSPSEKYCPVQMYCWCVWFRDVHSHQLPTCVSGQRRGWGEGVRLIRWEGIEVVIMGTGRGWEFLGVVPHPFSAHDIKGRVWYKPSKINSSIK